MTVCKGLKEELSECILEAVSALDPHSLIDVRYSARTNQLWVQFGDGLSGLVDLKKLGLESRMKLLILETAIVGNRGATLEIVKHDGDLFEIDALAIKAVLDDSLAALLRSEAKQSDKKVGERVRSARESARLTQQQLSKNTGNDQAIISKLERGIHQPRVDTLERIASALGLSLSELLAKI
jgi:DNA-binding XRE family transcriptional regulator